MCIQKSAGHVYEHTDVQACGHSRTHYGLVEDRSTFRGRNCGDCENAWHRGLAGERETASIDPRCHAAYLNGKRVGDTRNALGQRRVL